MWLQVLRTRVSPPRCQCSTVQRMASGPSQPTQQQGRAWAALTENAALARELTQSEAASLVRELIPRLDQLPFQDLEEVAYLLWQAHSICEHADRRARLSALPGSSRRRSRSPAVQPCSASADSSGLGVAADPTVPVQQQP